MRIALKELLRQPGRFVPVGGALTLLVVLLVVLGGFLDGLELGQTGAYRAHDGDLLAFTEDVDLQIQRSRVDAELADAVAAVDGVAEVGQLSQILTTAGTAAADQDVTGVAVFGYQLATDVIPAPPGGGAAVVDQQLGETLGLQVGDVIEVGPTAVQVTVDALVDDLSQGAATIWLDQGDWRNLVEQANPTALPPPGVSQALVVRPAGDLSEAAGVELANEVTDAVDGVEAATIPTTIESLDVVQQQSSTFAGIISVTFAVTLLVVALFFALITLERTALYAVLKALGARTTDLLVGISVQAIVISLVALLAGLGLSLAFSAALPPDLPVRLVPTRLAAIAAGTVVTALIGSLFTLRRILAIDPAEAIG
ncbi:ABC transporter permease [Euzebya tangerina]|uniref:ABC transporter permease n=1 Tax=Euzebya tangerina TaxID=591198 RepID=UPI000E32289F|nr:ABC transporter permease [Euzebya tangerina]